MERVYRVEKRIFVRDFAAAKVSNKNSFFKSLEQKFIFELGIEMKFEVCDPRSFSNNLNAQISIIASKCPALN